MNFFFLLKNLGAIMAAVSGFQTILGDIAKSNRKLPSVAQTQKLLDIIHDLIKKGVIDIPDVDDEKVFETFQVFAINIVAAMDSGAQAIDRYGDAQVRFIAAGVPSIPAPELKKAAESVLKEGES